MKTFKEYLQEREATFPAHMTKKEYVQYLITATDPDADPDDIVDIDKLINQARREYGTKFADDLTHGLDLFHYPRTSVLYGMPYSGSDRLLARSRNPNRITKAGKLNKQDAERLKKYIQAHLKY